MPRNGHYWQPNGLFQPGFGPVFALGGGLAVARALVFNSQVHKVLAHVIGGLLVIWGAGVFIYAIIRYHPPARDYHKRDSREIVGVMILMTATLLIIATLVFWITLQ